MIGPDGEAVCVWDTKSARRLLLLALAGAFALLLFEIFLRTPLAPTNWRRLVVGWHMGKYLRSDPELGYGLQAPYHRRIVLRDLDLEFTHVLAPIIAAKPASWGYRADGMGTKLESRADIVVLGGSRTYGWLVSDGNTWVSRLGTLTRLRAVNLGVLGYGTSQEALLYRLYGRVFRPRLVLLQLSSSDLKDNRIYRDWQAHEAAKGLDFWTYQYSQRLPLGFAWSIRAVKTLLRHSHAAVLLSILSSRILRNGRPQASEEALRVLKEDLVGLQDELSGSGRAFAIVIDPSTWPQRTVADIRAFLDGRRIPNLTLPRFVESREGLRIWGDGHWSERGHAVVAAEVYRFLLREDLLPPRSRR